MFQAAKLYDARSLESVGLAYRDMSDGFDDLL
jgi:hypothetical protein